MVPPKVVPFRFRVIRLRAIRTVQERKPGPTRVILIRLNSSVG
jgi:hypothetical protein